MPKSENPQPRMSTAHVSKLASSSNGKVYLHSKQELRNKNQHNSEEHLF